MRIVIRSTALQAAREAQQLLAVAGVEAAARASAHAAPDGEDILIVPALDGGLVAARALADAARASERPPLAIVLGRRWAAPALRDLSADESFTGAIALDAPATLLAAQMAGVIRDAIAREARRLRESVAQDLNTPVPAPLDPGALRALYVGAPSPVYLKLEHALAKHGGAVAAAFSSFAGFDHLHDGAFDAVVLNGAQNAATAISLCAALRRNAALYHMPTMMIVAAEDAATAKAAFERGACSAVTENAASGPSLGWLFEAVRANRARRADEHHLRALRDLLGDPRTGLFKRTSFDAVLARQSEAHQATGRPMALAALRVLPAHGARQPSANAWRRGFAEIGSLAGRLVRECDAAAAIGADLIAVAMPATDAMGARRAAERIASVAECTAFAAGDDGAGPLVFEQSVAELQPGESGAGLLARALRALEIESLTA